MPQAPAPVNIALVNELAQLVVARLSAELRRSSKISEHGIWRVLRRFNLNTRNKRLSLIARHAEPYERKPDQAPYELHIDASEPGEKVQMDCFYVGRLAGSKGSVIDLTSLATFGDNDCWHRPGTLPVSIAALVT